MLDRCSAAGIPEIIRRVLSLTLTITQDLPIHSGLLSYYVEHAILQCLFVLRQEVLLPRVVADIRIQVVPL